MQLWRQQCGARSALSAAQVVARLRGAGQLAAAVAGLGGSCRTSTVQIAGQPCRHTQPQVKQARARPRGRPHPAQTTQPAKPKQGCPTPPYLHSSLAPIPMRQSFHNQARGRWAEQWRCGAVAQQYSPPRHAALPGCGRLPPRGRRAAGPPLPPGAGPGVGAGRPPAARRAAGPAGAARRHTAAAAGLRATAGCVSRFVPARSAR